MEKEKILIKKSGSTLILGLIFLFLGIIEFIEGDSYLLGIALSWAGLWFIFDLYKEHLRSKFASRLINIINIILIVLFSGAFLFWLLGMLQII